MKTKGEIVRDAFSILLRTGVTVAATPEDVTLALMRMEDMIAEIESRNVITGYNFEQQPDPSTPSGLEDWMNLAIIRNLALNVWPDFSPDEVNPLVVPQAAKSMSNLMARLAMVPRSTYAGNMPLGTGQYLQRYRRFYGDYKGCK
jgi:hypothetical protein